MPQMSPLWWTTLFATFIYSFIMIWTLMYYQYSPKVSTKTQEKMENQMNWKW
uniref:ATP synthase complex subunit 8 n=1 Tax=Acanthaspis pedestris TaxID=1387356 RepID=A0A9E9BQ66_9HEMI|nr:ATP synthase F0 subunit 8 [Acanthaspis pedestris]WAJ48458.1 ATP synthase F0 subunit 8 [Acanthaspis pedestris]